MKIPYYPGCTLKSTAKHFENSAIASAKALDIEFIELPKWNCCGVVTPLAEDDIMHHVAPVRNMIRVLEMNKAGTVSNEKRLLTLCSMCFNTLKRSSLRVKEKIDDLDILNDFMYKEEDYDGSVEIVHFLEILKENGFDKINKKVKKSLKDLKVAPYYGCMLLRPKDIGLDDPERPTIFEELLSALNAPPVDWRAKNKCCGSFLTLENKETVAKLGHDILTNAQKSGADMIITSCPLCAFNLDNRQKIIKKIHPEFETIPVLYFTQLMAIAFGLDKELIGLDKNFINPIPLLESKGLL